MRTSEVFREDLFKDKIAIVTGGGTGIGLAITEELVRGGSKVVIASRKMERLVPAAKGLSRDYGAEVVPMRCNVRERKEVENLIDQTLERFEKVDFIVNNGGGQFLTPAEQLSEKHWHSVIDTNLNGTWYMCQTVARKWMLENGGKIVNIVAPLSRGMPGVVHTGASRAGVVNMTMSLAVEWARSGILINCLAPGGILSTGFHNYTPELLDFVWRSIPVKRFGRCEDVAWAVAYLFSPAGDYITGETIKVDGAHTLWNSHWKIPDPDTPPDMEIPEWPEQRWPEFSVKNKNDRERTEGP